MASTLLKRLREALERVEADREKLSQQAESFRQVIAYFESLNDEGETPTRASGKVLINEVWELLKAEGRAIHYREIYERLRARGVQVGGQDPVKNVGAHMSADPRFETLGKGMWGLKSWRKAQQQPDDNEQNSAGGPEQTQGTQPARNGIEPLRIVPSKPVLEGKIRMQ